MKAAVLFKYGESPKFEEYAAPIAKDGEILVNMVASSIKQVDRIIASGKHYTRYPSLPAIVGLDGIARLEDDSHIYVSGIRGALSQKAVVAVGSWTTVPENLSIELAAALPNALIGSDAAMLYRGGLKNNDCVIVNGATGATGRVAVQMAKNRGVDCVIAMGRLSSGLYELRELGADILIDTEQDEGLIINELSALISKYQPEIIVDYLWGRPAELLLKALSDVIKNEVKFITVGNMAGENISLSSAVLRSRKISILGSGIGSLSYSEISKYFSVDLPAAFQWAAKGKLKMSLQTVDLSDIENSWQTLEEKGKRMVVKI